ncbi:hypothetical protein [Duganella hordei]|uniref:hypothetical protein n=1 Tax=Duganella hordei TaxID=2865934 RepID=UPI0030EA366B
MLSAIKLTFKNLSNDVNNSKVYFFQRNVVASQNELPVAWKVIENCGKSDTNSFDFPLDMQVGVTDSYNNVTPLLDAVPGQSFEVVLDHSGDVLQELGNATSTTEVQINNNMASGAFTGGIYKGGKLLACKTGVYPNSMATFQFRPFIWVGAASQVVEGEVMKSAVLSQSNKQFSLEGIASATIVMYGGGAGPSAQPLTFALEDLQYA